MPNNQAHAALRHAHTLADRDEYDLHHVYGQAIDDVDLLHTHYRTRGHGALTAAILTLSTIHATPEGDTE